MSDIGVGESVGEHQPAGAGSSPRPGGTDGPGSDGPGSDPAPSPLGRLTRRAPALQRRNFRLFIGSQFVSLIGTWMQTLGQAWLVLVLTHDPFVLGLVTAAQGLPVLVFSLIGGVIADRAEKRRVIILTQSLMLVIALILGLLCLTGTVAVWHIVLLAFALGTVNAVEIPTRQSFVVEMVGPRLLASAVGLNSATYNSGRLIGPAVAGLVIGAATTALGNPIQATGVAFVINAASYLIVVTALLRMREEEMFPVQRKATVRSVRAVLKEIGEGLAFVRGAKPVLATLLVPGLIAMIAVNFQVLVPVLAQEEFAMDPTVLGLLLAAVGVGALTAALLIGVGGRAGPGALIGGALTLGLALLLTGFGPPLLVTAVLLFAAGAGATSMRTAANTTIQLATPPLLRGRVMSLFALVFEGWSPMGGLITGAVTAQFGGRVGFIVFGAAALLLLLVGARELSRVASARTQSAPRSESTTGGA